MSMDNAAKKNIDAWLNGPYDQKTKQDIKKLSENELIDAFSKTLNFGTGGIRALVGIGTNRLNNYTISFATQGLANYINKQNINKPSVIIGYDSRKHSKEFAEVSAKVLAANNIKVYLFSEMRPTPLVSFGLIEKKATAGIMITASHNPKEYNGYKVYYSDGGQVLPPHDTGIINEYNKLKKLENVKILDNLDSDMIEIIKEEIDEKYLKKLSNIKFFKNSKNTSFKFIYSNIHGVGITILPKALKLLGYDNIIYVDKQKSTNGDFEFAKKPNPEEKETLEPGIKLLLEHKAEIFLATDPDADRMGAVINHNNEAVILTGNQIACLILDYLCKTTQLPSKTAAVKSIVTTDLFEEICNSYKIKCFDVLTGFKYIAEKIHQWETDKSHEFLFGAEESYGYLLETFTRDKDAVSAACIMLEIVSYAKSQNQSLLDLLYDLYKKHGIYVSKQLSIAFNAKEQGMTQMKTIMSALRSNTPKTIANIEITKINDYNTLKSKDLKNNKTTSINLPQSNVLTYFLDDNTKLVIRPSGTEPKIKIYIEVQENDLKDIKSDIQKCEKRAEAILETIKDEIKNI